MANKYDEQFKANLAALNEAQREAVEHIEGPVMVIAGPGTGKTHILASRIGYIRMMTDAHASNILCLTFTEAGASAMRKRLLQIIGPEAHKVHIFTFHGFCNHIIRNHTELFGSRDMELLTELERIEIIRTMIDKLPANSPLTNFNDTYYYEPHLSSLFKVIKTENWTIEEIDSAIDDYNNSLPQRAGYQYQRPKKGELKEKAIAEEIAKMEKLRAAAKLYAMYQKSLAQKKRYDFDDMILWVIEAFANNENLLRNYQEQYLYFLIDEYQDTNGAQNTVLQQLITYWDLPNVFIVGDDDQAIYEFQGARLKSLKDLYAKFETSINVVVLKENYRSTQVILDDSRILIENNQNRIINDLKELGLDKRLVASNIALQKNEIKPCIVEYPTTIHEYAGIAIQIEKLIAEGESPENIAIIYAKNKQALTMMQLLDKKGVAYSTKRPINILQERIVQQILNLFRYLQAESEAPYSGEAYLFQILHYQCWQISSREIAQLALYLRQKNRDAEQPIYWRQAISKQQRPSILAEAKLEESEAFFRASQILEKLCDDVNRVSIAQLYERVLNQTGILRYAIDAPDALNEVQTLHTMFAFVQKELEKRKTFTLQELILTLSTMENHRLSLPMQKTISATNGVLLTTAHSSKGLEFKHVFMIDCSEDAWAESGKNPRNNFKLPDTLTLTQGEEESSMEARRRLFYVAMTRAKQHLQISYSLSEKGQRASFIEELLLQTDLTLENRELSQADAMAAGFLLLDDSNKNLTTQNEAFIEEVLTDFALSPSSLNRYLDCPLSFYYEYLLKVPVTGSEALSYGSAMHAALEDFSRKYKRDRKLPSQKDLLVFFERNIQQEKHQFSPSRYQQRLDNGKNRLSAYYQSVIAHWQPDVEIELRLKQGTIDDVPVSGIIDRIEYSADGEVIITDFKTGAFKQSHVSVLSESKPQGGNYRRQLLFYKLMFEQHILGNRPVKMAQLAYLEPDALGHFPIKSYEFGEQEIDLFKNLLQTTYKKIKNKEFQEGCGKERCHWCKFVKNHVAPDSFLNQDIEDLDDAVS